MNRREFLSAFGAGSAAFVIWPRLGRHHHLPPPTALRITNTGNVRITNTSDARVVFDVSH
jgi:hypothetical protein